MNDVHSALRQVVPAGRLGAARSAWVVPLLLALALLLVAGCAPSYYPPLSAQQLAALPDRNAALRHCCDKANGGLTTETALTIERNSFWVLPFSRKVKLRPGWLEDDPEAWTALLDRARPLDVILIGNDSRLSGLSGPGLFGHAAIYLGTEAQLRALGIWDDPAVVPFHPDIRKGKVAIEALDIDVHLSGPPALFETDHMALLRPRAISAARKRTAAIALFREIGAPFDFHFDNGDPSQIYCTELIDRVLPELRLPAREIYGRELILPDDVAARVLTGEVPMDLVLFIRGYPVGWRSLGENDLAALLLTQYP